MKSKNLKILPSQTVMQAEENVMSVDENKSSEDAEDEGYYFSEDIAIEEEIAAIAPPNNDDVEEEDGEEAEEDDVDLISVERGSSSDGSHYSSPSNATESDQDFDSEEEKNGRFALRSSFKNSKSKATTTKSKKKNVGAKGKGKASGSHIGRPKKDRAITPADLQLDEEIRLQTLSKEKETLKPFIHLKLYEKLKSLAKSSSKVNEEADSFVPLKKQPPTVLNCKLRDYQLDGVNWLIENYHKRLNCILADEMGLGKTLQTITFLSYLLHQKNISGPMLVAVPLTVLFNWQNELHKWCPSIRIFRIHCTDPQEHVNIRSKMTNTEEYDVIITTYEMLTLSGLSYTFRSIIWRCIVLDEGHRIKNEKTDCAIACHKLHGQFKVLLTGTPLQNSLHELGSLLSFLFPTIFMDLTIFDAGFALSGRTTMNIDRNLLG